MKKESKDKKRKLWKNLLLLLITIILFLIISELVFRIITHEPKGSWFREKDLDEQRMMWAEYYSRTLEDYDIEKPEGVFRIAVVGDSFTQGGGYVDGADLLSDSFPDYLEILLNKNFDDVEYQVLNFGFSSTTTLEEYYIIKEAVFDYEPDLIILGVTANDQWFGVYNLDPFRYCDMNTNSYERVMYQINKNWKLFSHLYTKLPEANQYIDVINPRHPLGMRCVNRSLHRIKKLISDEDLPVFAVFINDVIYYEAPGKELYMDYFDYTNAVVPFNQSFISSGLDVVYTHPYFLEIPYIKIVADDLYHYNERGNMLIAKIVYNYMLKNNAIPSCKSQDCTLKLVEAVLE